MDPPVGVLPVGPGLLLVGPGYLSGCEGVEDGDEALDVVGRLDCTSEDRVGAGVSVGVFSEPPELCAVVGAVVG